MPGLRTIFPRSLAQATRCVAVAFRLRRVVLLAPSIVLLMITAALFAACAGSSSTMRATPGTAVPIAPVTFATTTIRIEGAATRTINVEVATTAAQSERGLGYRDSLAADAGMIFDLHTTTRPTFWMKGMRIPLDMVWIGEDKRVAGVAANVAPQPGVADDQLRRYSSDTPVRYVLELNAGAAARLGFAPGTQLAFALP